MIFEIKQKVKNYLKQKYDVRYREKLEQQVITYDTWICQKEAKEKEQFQKRKKDLPNKSRIFPYSLLGDWKKFCKTATEALEEADYVILTHSVKDLKEEAKEWISSVFDQDKNVEIVYADEDEVNSSGTLRKNPWLKPDYSPDTLLSYFYFGSMVAVRKEKLLQAIKILNTRREDQETGLAGILGEEGRKEEKKYLYALILEACLFADRKQIYHLRKMAVSSRSISYWGQESEYQSLRDFYDRLRKREETKGVSIVIPSKDHPEVLERCINSIEKYTEKTSYEILVIDNGSREDHRREIEKLQKKYGFRYFYEPMEFNFSKMCNLGAYYAKYDMFLFLNDDCEVKEGDWLTSMVTLAEVKTTGAVGAKLYYPESKRIQHCGIYNIHVGPVHKLQFKEDIRSYYDRRNKDIRNVLAVTAACLMVRKKVFYSVKGFEEELQVAFNDVDFCYKLYEEGYDNVVNNNISLWHHESFSRGSDETPEKLHRLQAEKQKLYEKHKELWDNDPYYHPGFATDILDTGYSFSYEYSAGEDFKVEKPVRCRKLPTKVREDECVVPMIEYAGDLKGWFLDETKVKKLKEGRREGQMAYLQGNVVVLGSDNACYEIQLLLQEKEREEWYQIFPQSYYRPDIFHNLADQENVALSGFACLIDMSEIPMGKYDVCIMAKDKISGQYLLRTTGRSVEKMLL